MSKLTYWHTLNSYNNSPMSIKLNKPSDNKYKLLKVQGALVTNTTHQTTPYSVASDAPVTVVEFFDYQCIYCSRLAHFINDLHQDTQLQFVFHETPIFGSRWPMSTLAAKVGNAVYKTKGMAAYDSYHRVLFATGHNEGQLTQQDIQITLTTLSLIVMPTKPPRWRIFT
jgi:protein-disulfide isomerase